MQMYVHSSALTERVLALPDHEWRGSSQHTQKPVALVSQEELRKTETLENALWAAITLGAMGALIVSLRF